MSRPVELVWLVVALPILAMLINLALTIPHSIRVRDASAPAGGGHGGHDHDVASGHAEPNTEAGHEARDESHAGGHGTDDGHGGGHGAGHGHGAERTPLGALLGGWIGVVLVGLSFVLSLLIFFEFMGDAGLRAGGYTLHLYDWFSFGPLKYAIDFRVDTLTVIMLLVVTSVSTLVHMYSIGYMAGDVSFSRFFTELALFTVSMLILVLAANFLVIFIGWELVGLSSYL